MSPTPPVDFQTAPTRADLLAAIQGDGVPDSIAALDAKLNLVLAALVNTQAQLTALAADLAAAGVAPGILTDILAASRTD